MSLFQSIFGGSKTSSQPSSVWGGQSPFLLNLYARAQNASMGLPQGGAVQPVTPAAGGYGGGGMFASGNSKLRGGAGGNDRRQAGGPTQGMPAPGWQDPLSVLGGSLLGQGQGMANQLQMLGQVGNPFAQAQIGQLGQELGNIYQRNILPGITSNFSLANGLGGDRMALAMGEAAGRLGEQFRGGALDILGNSAGLALGANQAGLGSLGGLFGLGNAALFGSLPGLQSILGNPTVLGGGSSSNQTPGILGALSGLVGTGGIRSQF